MRDAVGEIAPRRDVTNEQRAVFASGVAPPPRHERAVVRRVPPVERRGRVGGERGGIEERAVGPVAPFAHVEDRLRFGAAPPLVEVATHAPLRDAGHRRRHRADFQELRQARRDPCAFGDRSDEAGGDRVLLRRPRADLVGVAVFEPPIGIGDERAAVVVDDVDRPRLHGRHDTARASVPRDGAAAHPALERRRVREAWHPRDEGGSRRRGRRRRLRAGARAERIQPRAQPFAIATASRGGAGRDLRARRDAGRVRLRGAAREGARPRAAAGSRRVGGEPRVEPRAGRLLFGHRRRCARGGVPWNPGDRRERSPEARLRRRRPRRREVSPSIYSAARRSRRRRS